MGRSACCSPGSSPGVRPVAGRTPSRATSPACTSPAPASLAPPEGGQGRPGGARGERSRRREGLGGATERGVGEEGERG